MKLHITENYKISYDEPIYKGDLFINKDGITKQVVRIVDDNVTVRDVNTGMINHIRKDYLVNNFELVDDEEEFEECIPAKTSYMGEEKVKNYAYNLDNDESRRKEVADRFGKPFTPDDHILVCKDGKKLNIQVGKKYKCTATNGQRVEIVSIDRLFPEDDGDSALITAYWRGKMIAIGSTQLFESNNRTNKSRTKMNEDYDPNGFAVTGYLHPNKMGAYADRYFGPNDWSEVEAYAHDLLMKGLYTNIWYCKTGDMIDIDPDEYANNFDGEFEATPEIAEFKEKVFYNESLTEKCLNETEEYTDGVVNFSVPYNVTNLDEYDREQFDSLIDWCNDYLSEYGLDAYIQTTRHYQNELSVFYDIEDLETTTHKEVNTVICQAIGDFFVNED